MEKVALITGASRGIGRETALLLWRRGYSVAINYLRAAESAEAMAKELCRLRPGSALAVPADVSDRGQVDAMFARVRETLGDPDVLVNNAGIAQQKLFTDVTEAEWDRIFAVNVKGMFHCAQAALPAMVRRRRGKIVNLSSMWGQVGASCEVAYSAAKGAVIAFTKALAQEVGPSGIQVNCVAPGVIETEMNGNLSAETLAALREETPLGVLGKPSDAAEAIAFLVSGGADFITGQVLAPNGGMVL
ncbi:MAG: elongation factor P 5-aminopentanone reductase [Candidatus Merdivicinus sp.]|jgi:3-oxoacyl-[acyl-carrier protein] reductase